MAKVIDALVVTLGLDPSGYKKGAAQAKSATDDLKGSTQVEAKTSQTTAEAGGKSAQKLGTERRKQDTEERKRQRLREREARQKQAQEQKDTEASIGRLKSLGIAAAGFVVGFNSIKGAIEAYLGATSQLANLGRLAPTIGTDVKALDTLGNAYKEVGGKAEDAGSDIAKLAHAQFSFAINAPDALAGWARRLGVSLFDDKGKERDKLQIQQDIADALKRRTKDVQTQAMYAREMGMSEAFIQLYLVKQADERAKILSDAEKTAKASKEAADAAIKEEQARSRIKNVMKGIGQKIVGAASPLITRVENNLANTGQDVLTQLDTGMPAWVSKNKKSNAFAPAFVAAAKKYGVPAALLAGIARRESNFDPKAESKKNGRVVGRGLMQLNPQFFPHAGENAEADIDVAAKEFARLYRRRLAQGLSTRDAQFKALQDYNDGQKNVARREAAGKPLPAETAKYAPAVLSYAGMMSSATAPGSDRSGDINRTSTNTTHIEELNIHTQATDAAGIAATIPDALRRQNVVAQANTGLQ